MTADKDCERDMRLQDLRERLDVVGLILRWLWTTNFVAAIVGLGVHLYWLAGVASISSAVSLVGAAELRRVIKHLADLGIRYGREQ